MVFLSFPRLSSVIFVVDGLLCIVQCIGQSHIVPTALLYGCFGNLIYTFLLGICLKVEVLSRRVCIVPGLEGTDEQLYKVVEPICAPINLVFKKKF